MRAGSLDLALARVFSELLGAGGGVGYISDLIDPFRRADPTSFLFADLIPYHWFVAGGGWVPWDAGDNEISVYCVDRVEVYPEGGEAFPVLHFWIPEVANSGAAGIREGVPFAPTIESQRPALFVCYEWIPKDRLPEHFCRVGRLRLA